MRKMFPYFKALFLTKPSTNWSIFFLIVVKTAVPKLWCICQLKLLKHSYHASALFIEMYQVVLRKSKLPWVKFPCNEQYSVLFERFDIFTVLLKNNYKKLWSIKYFCHIKMNNLQYTGFKIVKVCWLSTSKKKKPFLVFWKFTNN